MPGQRQRISARWSIAPASTSGRLASDRQTLFFGSDRAGGFGGVDLYVTTRTKTQKTDDRAVTAAILR